MRCKYGVNSFHFSITIDLLHRTVWEVILPNTFKKYWQVIGQTIFISPSITGELQPIRSTNYMMQQESQSQSGEEWRHFFIEKTLHYSSLFFLNEELLLWFNFMLKHLWLPGHLCWFKIKVVLSSHLNRTQVLWSPMSPSDYDLLILQNAAASQFVFLYPNLFGIVCSQSTFRNLPWQDSFVMWAGLHQILNTLHLSGC